MSVSADIKLPSSFSTLPVTEPLPVPLVLPPARFQRGNGRYRVSNQAKRNKQALCVPFFAELGDTGSASAFVSAGPDGCFGCAALAFASAEAGDCAGVAVCAAGAEAFADGAAAAFAFAFPGCCCCCCWPSTNGENGGVAPGALSGVTSGVVNGGRTVDEPDLLNKASA